jgi:hypothetical protein
MAIKILNISLDFLFRINAINRAATIKEFNKKNNIFKPDKKK